MARSANRSARTGRFVSARTAAASPKTTVRQTFSSDKVGRTVNQSAITGRFLSNASAARHPDTTIQREV